MNIRVDQTTVDWNSASLTPAAARLLTTPRKWRIVSSAFEPEVSPINDEHHLEWMQENSHSHAHQEIKVVLKGRGAFGFRGKAYPFSPGTMFLMDCLEEHDNKCPLDSSDAKMLWVVIVKNLVMYTQILIKNGDFQYYRWNRMDNHHTLGFTEWQNMMAYIKRPDLSDNSRRLRAYSVATGLLSSILDNGFIDDTIGNKETFQRNVIETVEKHIVSDHSIGISLDTLSHMSGYSKYHLSRLFKHYTGRNIREHVQHCRMCEVQDLLSQGLTKKEISSRLGFSCPAAFSRWLRQYAE